MERRRARTHHPPPGAAHLRRLAIAAGVNAKALSTYMGHSSIQVTFDKYGHLMPGNEQEAADLLDTFLERVRDAAR